jgi:hypothetical protein
LSSRQRVIVKSTMNCRLHGSFEFPDEGVANSTCSVVCQHGGFLPQRNRTDDDNTAHYLNLAVASTAAKVPSIVTVESNKAGTIVSALVSIPHLIRGTWRDSALTG